MQCARRWLGMLTPVFLAGCTQHIDSNESLPGPSQPPPILTRPTEVSVAASVTLAQLQQLCNEKVPDTGPIDQPLFRHWHLSGNWSRSRIELTPLPPGIGFSAAHVHADGHAPVGWSADGRASGSGAPAVDRSYAIHSNAHLDLHFDNAQVHFLGTHGIAGLLNEHVAGMLNKAAGSLDDSLNKKARLHDRAALLWKSGFGVQKLNTGTPVFIVHSPTQIRIANPVVASDGTVRFGLGIAGNLQLVAATDTLSPPVMPLPAATIVPGLDGRFRFDVPVVIDPANIGPVITGAIARGRVKSDLGPVKIRKVDVGAEGTRMVVRLALQAGHFWRPIEATAFVQVEPYIDEETQTLAFRKVSFTLKTQERFTETAAEFVAPTVATLIEDKARFPLARQEAAARDALSRLAGDVHGRSHGLATVKLEEVKLGTLQVLSGYLVLEILATGSVATNLQLLGGE